MRKSTMSQELVFLRENWKIHRERGAGQSTSSYAGHLRSVLQEFNLYPTATFDLYRFVNICFGFGKLCDLE